jgi:adenosylhomocysteine nucleosidase
MDLKKYKRVGIVVAMASESESLLSAIAFEKTESEPFEIYRCKNLYLIGCGYGTLNAAIASQYLIEKYGVDCLVNYGVCGYTGKANYHGVLFSVSKAYKRDVDCRLLGYPRYAYPDDVPFIELSCDKTIPVGELYTSDEFVGAESDVPDGVLVDMEGYSVAFVSRKYKKDCFLFKSVCDSTEENTDRTEYDNKLDGALMGMDEYINKMFADYIAES